MLGWDSQKSVRAEIGLNLGTAGVTSDFRGIRVPGGGATQKAGAALPGRILCVKTVRVTGEICLELIAGPADSDTGYLSANNGMSPAHIQYFPELRE
jgi:hypothetical protein